ncbi:GMP synthase (glutamine-hydrolyzing) [Sarracenia purpurea var. burkii]
MVGPDDHVICASSGGEDSAVSATLVHKAIGDRLHCVFVDNALLRYKDRERVLETFERDLHLPVTFVDATGQFLNRLKGVVDRKIIGKEIICIFDTFAQDLEHKLGNKPANLPKFWSCFAMCNAFLYGVLLHCKQRPLCSWTPKKCEQQPSTHYKTLIDRRSITAFEFIIPRGRAIAERGRGVVKVGTGRALVARRTAGGEVGRDDAGEVRDGRAVEAHEAAMRRRWMIAVDISVGATCPIAMVKGYRNIFWL